MNLTGHVFYTRGALIDCAFCIVQLNRLKKILRSGWKLLQSSSSCMGITLWKVGWAGSRRTLQSKQFWTFDPSILCPPQVPGCDCAQHGWLAHWVWGGSKSHLGVQARGPHEHCCIPPGADWWTKSAEFIFSQFLQADLGEYIRAEETLL